MSTDNAHDDSFKEVLIHEILQVAINKAAHALDNKSIELILDYDEVVGCIVCCRKAEVVQVLLNLIENASRRVVHLDEKWIRVEGFIKNNCLNVDVYDSSTGILKEECQKIFESNDNTSGLDNSSVDGLRESQKIMEQNNGSLEYCDEAKNTCFVLTIPLLSMEHSSTKLKVPGTPCKC